MPLECALSPFPGSTPLARELTCRRSHGYTTGVRLRSLPTAYLTHSSTAQHAICLA